MNQYKYPPFLPPAVKKAIYNILDQCRENKTIFLYFNTKLLKDSVNITFPQYVSFQASYQKVNNFFLEVNLILYIYI